MFTSGKKLMQAKSKMRESAFDQKCVQSVHYYGSKPSSYSCTL